MPNNSLSGRTVNSVLRYSEKAFFGMQWNASCENKITINK